MRWSSGPETARNAGARGAVRVRPRTRCQLQYRPRPRRKLAGTGRRAPPGRPGFRPERPLARPFARAGTRSRGRKVDGTGAEVGGTGPRNVAMRPRCGCANGHHRRQIQPHTGRERCGTGTDPTDNCLLELRLARGCGRADALFHSVTAGGSGPVGEDCRPDRRVLSRQSCPEKPPPVA